MAVWYAPGEERQLCRAPAHDLSLSSQWADRHGAGQRFSVLPGRWGGGDSQNIINADLVDCIVAMPSQLFYTTQIPVSLWFLAKNKKQKGKTLFIDARKMGTMVTRKLRELTDGSKDPADNDIKKLADTYNAFVDGTLEEVKGFCAVADTEEIAKQDYILTPGRYVGIEEQEDDGEPFEEKMGRLTKELSELFQKSHELEAQIKERLGAIGYEV